MRLIGNGFMLHIFAALLLTPSNFSLKKTLKKMHVGHTEAGQLKSVNNNNNEENNVCTIFQCHTIHNMFRTCIAAIAFMVEYLSICANVINT